MYVIELSKSNSLNIKQRWFWRVREVHSGQVVSTGGEGYATKWNAKRAAVKQHPDLSVVTVKGA